jgi:hypothetical protein
MLVLSACGGSHHSTTTTATSSPRTTGTLGTTTGTPGTTTSTSPGVTTGTLPSTTTTTGASSTGGGQTTSTSSTSTGPATTKTTGPQTARLPATFTITAGDQVNPPTVNAPALVAIQLTIVSGDGKAHTALVRTSPPHTLHVAPHRRATLLLPGQSNGRYVIVIDRGGLASLVVGGAPGP